MNLAVARTVWAIVRQGGLTVDTPKQDPLIATLVQLDGEVTVSVHRRLLSPALTRERDRIVAEHFARVRERMVPLAQFVTEMRRLDALMLRGRRYAFGTGLLLGAVPATGALRGAVLWHVGLSALPSLALLLISLLFRPASVWFLRHRVLRAVDEIGIET